MSNECADKILEGISFRDFVLEYARPFLDHFSGDFQGVDVSKWIRKETHHRESLAEMETELARLLSLSESDMVIEMENQRLKMEERNRRIVEYNEERRQKYQAMLDKVLAWTPPCKAFESTKRRLAENIQSAILQDYRSIEELKQYLSVWYPMTVSEFMSQKIKDLEENINFFKREIAFIDKMNRERAEEIRLLDESLK